MAMEPFEEEHFDGNERPEARVPANQWLVIALIVLLGIAGIAAAYGVHERGQVEQLTTQAATANNAMNQMQAQVKALTARLNEITATPETAAAPGPAGPAISSTPPMDENVEIPAVAAPPATAAVVATPKPAPTKKTTAKRKAPVDKRYAQLKAQLDDQQKQLKQTQDQVAKNRADLEGSISSTRE